MTSIETPSKSNQIKRKIEQDSEDELFFKYESEKKKKSIDSNEENLSTDIDSEEKQPNKMKKSPVNKNVESDKIKSPKKENKENIENKHQTPKTKESIKSTEEPVSSSPMQKQNKLKQGKLSFKPLETKEKPVSKEPSKEVLEAEARGEFKIENYLNDPEWKQLLKDEFKKPYFIDINSKIKPGYEKGINRPPKELVFNALNTTKLKNVN